MEDDLEIIEENKKMVKIGNGIEVIGMKKVIEIEIIGVLKKDWEDDVDRVDEIGWGGREDFGEKGWVIFKKVVDIMVFILISGDKIMGEIGRREGNWRMIWVEVEGRKESKRMGDMDGKEEWKRNKGKGEERFWIGNGKKKKERDDEVRYDGNWEEKRINIVKKKKKLKGK